MQELQDIYRLQAFVTVVDEGSLSAAVHKLHITQPALSARLKLLEESLDCVLLERTGRGVRPTPMGKLVYNFGVDILKRMKQLQTTVKNHLEMREGWVHLGGGATAVSGIFPDAIQRFREKHPNIQFTLHEQESQKVIESLHDGAIDLGVVTHNPLVPKSEDPLQGLTIHGEIQDDLVVIASPQNPIVDMMHKLRSAGRTLLPIHLNRQPMILFGEGSAIRNIIEMEFRRLYIHPKVVMTLRSSQSMVRMVAKNIGLSVVSKLTIQNDEKVEILDVEDLRMRRRILIVSSSDRTLPPAAQEFANLLCLINRI